jgi:hypothetical protein
LTRNANVPDRTVKMCGDSAFAHTCGLGDVAQLEFSDESPQTYDALSFFERFD